MVQQSINVSVAVPHGDKGYALLGIASLYKNQYSPGLLTDEVVLWHEAKNLLEKTIGHSATIKDMMKTLVISDDEYKSLNKKKLCPVSIPRIHPDEHYIEYFTVADESLNKLRKLLIALTKDEMQQYSLEMDKNGDADVTLIHTRLLIDALRKLYKECQDYLSKRRNKDRVPLTL